MSASQDLGADEVIDYTQQTVDKVFKNNPFDAVIDQIGGKSQACQLACRCLTSLQAVYAY